MKLVFRAAALEELSEAVAWYLNKAGQRQADAFRDELNAKLALLMEHPEIGTPGQRGTRWMPLKVFPYTLHYRVDGDTIRVFAVAHQRRRPGYWRKR
jgi:toxin ParE1/3/4